MWAAIQLKLQFIPNFTENPSRKHLLFPSKFTEAKRTQFPWINSNLRPQYNYSLITIINLQFLDISLTKYTRSWQSNRPALRKLLQISRKISHTNENRPPLIENVFQKIYFANHDSIELIELDHTSKILKKLIDFKTEAIELLLPLKYA